MRNTAATACRSASVRSGEDMGTFVIGGFAAMTGQGLLSGMWINLGQVDPARTTALSGTSLLIVAPLPMRAPAPICTCRLTVTPIPTSGRSPTCTSPARMAPGDRLAYSPSWQSCETIAPVLMMAPNPMTGLAAHVGVRHHLHAGVRAGRLVRHRR